MEDNLAFTYVTEQFPNYKGSFAKVWIKLSSGKITKGMFYFNGKMPTFASYGSTPKDVIAWAYRM